MKLRLTTLGGILTVLLALSVAAVIGVSVRSISGIEGMRGTWIEFEEGAGTKVVLLQRLNAALGYGGMIHQFKNYILRKDARRVDVVRSRMEDALATIGDYRAIARSSEEFAALDTIETMIRQYRRSLETAVRMIADGRFTDEIDRTVIVDDGPALAALEKLTQSFVDTKAESAAAIERAAENTEKIANRGAVAVSVALVVVSLLLGWFLLVRLGPPLRSMTDVMERLARGDTSVAVDVGDRRDEIGDMAITVGVFRENAQRIARMEDAAQAVVHSIATTASQVQGAVNAQATSSSEQAASIAETSTSLEEIRETAASTQTRVREMSASARRTLVEGEAGAAEMHDSIAAMDQIRHKVEAIADTIVTLSERNRRVGEITDTVNNLAQQSKMLAINASIEAAKAGDAGKGFAVVADEMGNLADQSEEATEQVRSVLEEIQAATGKAVLATEDGSKQVDVGVSLIQSVGARIESLSETIQGAVTEAERIDIAVSQQTAGIEQVARAMKEITTTTSQFAGTSAEIRDLMESLVNEVNTLTRVRG